MLKKIIFTTAVAAAAVAFVFSARPAVAQEHEHRVPVLLAPVDGATVPNPVTVAFGFPGGDQPPPPGGGHHGHGAHLYLFVDAAPPQPGMPVEADANHMPFPEGQQQMTLTLSPGQHHLQLVGVDRQGKVGRRAVPAAPITVSVR